MTSNRAFAALVRERSLPQDLLLDHAHADFAPVLRQVLDAPMSFITRHAPIGAAIRADHAIGALIAKLSRELASCESAEVAP
jgi:hypothetical protein